MKQGLLGGTALVGATALLAGAAGAAEAPEYKLSGGMNFQLYWVDQHQTWQTDGDVEWGSIIEPDDDTDDSRPQEHGWYFGVDEAELALNVSGAADNGLKYGFKIEIQTNTTDGTVADEARIQLSGSWGTLQLGDEDGAEDSMNYGGENLMGATGGFDGDQDDYMLRAAFTGTDTYQTAADHNMSVQGFGSAVDYVLSKGFILGAPSYPTIAGDTSDATKITYYSPRFSGFQVGASLTPTPNNGDSFKADGDWENHYGLGANYDNTFGSLRLQASAVYSARASTSPWREDVSAWSVGGIVGWGAFSIGANYTDNGDSGTMIADDDNGGGPGANTDPISLGIETSYWNVAAKFETGPMAFAAGYFVSTKDWGLLANDLINGGAESTYSHIALTADYTMAPGLGVYGEINLIEDEHNLDNVDGSVGSSNDITSIVLGVNVSF